MRKDREPRRSEGSPTQPSPKRGRRQGRVGMVCPVPLVPFFDGVTRVNPGAPSAKPPSEAGDEGGENDAGNGS